MPRPYWLAALSVWPGLPQIWSGQDVLGLILAGLFAATLNLAILSRYLWTELLAPGVPPFLAALAGVTWLAALGYTVWWVWRCHPGRFQAEIDTLFRSAQEQYLQGRFNEARITLERILTLDEADADALMHLGTLYVHTRQPALARRTFRQCLELEGGVKWRWEIQQMLHRLDAR